MAKTKWLKKAIGEISKLLAPVASFSFGSSAAPYALKSQKVNYELTKQLYKNIHDDYKLGAAFARPVIDTCVGFMGTPTLRSEDEDAQAVLDDHFGRWTGRFLAATRNCLRDGDHFFRLVRVDEGQSKLYKQTGPRIDLRVIPAGQIKDIETDPVTGDILAYVREVKVRWGPEKRKEYVVTERIAADMTEIKREGDVPPNVDKKEEHPNHWGFIPVVHFKNEAEEDELYGSSDLEPIEPFMKAYHDVMLHAMQGSKLHSTPKMKLKVKDVKSFLLYNFGVDLDKLKPGEKPSISLEGREILILKDDEEAGFIEVKSPTGAAETLLKFLFYCIVDVSQTPEFAFGTHVKSSNASVQEQMTPLIRKIQRKRGQFEEQYQLLGRMLLSMWEQSGGYSVDTYDTVVDWDEITEKDKKALAETLERVVKALSQAVQDGLMGLESAVEFLQQYVPTMMNWISDDPETPGERERIIRTLIMRRRLEDGEGLKDEGKAIDELLGNEGAA